MAGIRKDGKNSAPKTRLEEGEDSISRAQPSDFTDSKGTVARILRWSIRPYGFATPLSFKTQAKKGVSDAELKRRARKKAEKVLESEAGREAWNLSSSVSSYVDEVVKPAIQNLNHLSDLTRKRYLLSLRLIMGDCQDKSHTHQHSLKRATLREATRFRALERNLLEIAKFHGAESARQCRTVITGYLIAELRRDGLVDFNPLGGVRLDLKSNAREYERKAPRGGVALTKEEYQLVIDYLLDRKPEDNVKAPSRGRWGKEHVIAKWESVIKLTLLQAATGLRVDEALNLKWKQVKENSGGYLEIEVTSEIAKGGVERISYVLEPRVASRLKAEISSGVLDQEFVITSPTGKKWEKNNALRAVRILYLEIYENLKIPAFETERSHLWRATLNTLLLGSIPEVMRAAQFGHTVAVNRKSYTDDKFSPEMVRQGALDLSEK